MHVPFRIRWRMLEDALLMKYGNVVLFSLAVNLRKAQKVLLIVDRASRQQVFLVV